MVYSGISDDVGTISQFTRMKYIYVTTNGSSTPVNYQVKLTIAYEPEMQADFSDIRFNTLGNVYIDYWIESKTNSVTATVWVELPDAIAHPGSVSIWMYYGNAGLSNGGNGNDTFEFFDDFEYADNPINHGWTLVSGTYNSNYVTSTDYAKRGSKSLKLYPGSTQTIMLKRIFSATNQIAVDVDYYETNNTENTIYTGLQINKTTNGIIDGSPWCYNHANYKGTANNIVIISSVARANGWHKYTNQRDGINVKSFVDDVELTQAAYASSQTVLEAGLLSGSGVANWDSTRYYDSFRVRKYIANEPTPSYGTAQHQRRTPQFIN